MCRNSLLWIVQYGYKSLIRHKVCKYFLPFLFFLFVYFLFYFSDVFWRIKVFILVKFIVSIFLLSLELFISHLRWLCLTQCHGNLLIFCSKSFIVLPLTFRFVIHLELIFVHSVRNGFNFTFFTWPSSCSITICWKDYSPLNCYGMWVKKLIDHKCLGLFLGFQFYSIDLHVILMSTCYFCFCCSVAKLSLTLCDPIDWSTPGSSVLHYLQEFAQIHFHWVGDAI